MGEGMKKTISFCLFHWRKFAWGGTGAALATLGSQLDKPFSEWCFITAAVCSIIAANDRPQKGEDAS